MSSQEIRRKFLHYFKNKGHTLVPSSPVVPMGDPTLLFNNAGMNQFKDLFLGKTTRDYSKAASSQKCIRAGGKHNDLENVGHTKRHLTFFEMLGNFSFGDYFKKEAIDFAWELTLNIFEFDKDKLWATVFYEDEESFSLWTRHLPEHRIVRMGEKDNFWAMGDTGPCGPCSELYYDRGERFGNARSPAEDIEGERFLEFWNLVFMQFNRNLDGQLHPLPKQSVDTGAGLERVVSLKMDVDSLFETDILRELIAGVENLSGISYDPTSDGAAPFRVIADHTRTLAFAIADGVQPSNLDRGYVLRKILRRAVRYGRQIGLERPFLSDLLPRLVTTMGNDFPEIIAAQARIAEIITLEEEAFQRTLKRGGALLHQVMTNSQSKGAISGEDAFKLKDTYGLPLEEILLLAKDAHLGVDIAHFEELEHEAKERSRGARKATHQLATTSVYETFLNKHGEPQFLGYKELSCEAVVLGIMQEGKEIAALHSGETGTILLNQTPFYAEKGGQVGDQGILSSEKGRFEVTDCQSPFGDVIAHEGVLLSGEIHVGDRVCATVNAKRREEIAANHTATHLLNYALRNILGTHVKQAGSVVDAARLRFDFSHHKSLNVKEIEAIENLVNEKVRANTQVSTYELKLADVQERTDIIQFFGEKYGSEVRVVDIDFSKELCGGTHALSTGAIGSFRIVKESSIAAGIRRIEAVTGQEALNFSREEKTNLQGELAKAAEEQKALAQEVEKLRKKFLAIEVEGLISRIQPVGSTPLLAATVDMGAEDLKTSADMIQAKSTSLVLFLIGKEKEKCTLLVRVSADLVQKGIKAMDLLKEVAPLLSAKGGGKADAAQGGGSNLAQIPQTLERARQWLEQKTT